MARTFIDQPTQVFHSDTYNDQFASGINLVSSSTNLEDDLNALRTQVRQLLWAGAAGNWYDSVEGVVNLSFARGLNTINSSLTNVEQQRFIYDVQQLGFTVVPSGSNFVSLSVSGSTAPSGLAAVGLGTNSGSFTGSVVATLSGSSTGNGQAGSAHSLNLISGTSAISPRNIVSVRDAYTHLAFNDATHGNHEVYGLLQIDSGALDAQAFSDTAPGRTQISFVVEFPSGTWVPASTASIGGKIINYQYRARTSYLGLPEDAYTNTVFVDVTPGGGGAQLSDITLQEAINNQANVTVDGNGFNTTIDLAGGGNSSWSFLSASQRLWSLLASTNTLMINANTLSVSSSNPAGFLKGIQVATGSAEIDIGVKLGTIGTLSGTNLVLSGGAQLKFSDFFGPQSTYTGGEVPLAVSTVEWSTFFSDFGASSILGAFNFLSSSLFGVNSGSLVRSRASAGVTASIAAGTNVTFPGALDAPLLSYSGRDFINDVNVYLNGVLLMPGPSSTNPNDVYPGTSATSGDLKFPMNLRSGSILSMEVFGKHG